MHNDENHHAHEVLISVGQLRSFLRTLLLFFAKMNYCDFMRFGKPKVQIVCEVDISIMNSNAGGLPSGPARCEFMQDGSIKLFLTETNDSYAVGSGTKLPWQYGLMGIVNKESIYLSIGLGISAKIVDSEVNNEVEDWLKIHHPQS